MTRNCMLFTSALALALAGCGGSGTTRVASIGSVPDTGSTGSTAGGDSGGGNTGDAGGGGSGSGGTGSDSGSGGGGSSSGNGGNGGATPLGGPILVTAGNAVIGLGDKHNALAQVVNGKVAVAGPITGTVTAVLRKTGQTLVDLGNGRSAVLNKAGGVVGRLVTIDLGTGRVIGAPGATSLIGVAALTPTQLAQASVANPAAGKVTGLSGTVGTIANTATGALTGATGSPVTSVVGGVLGKATSVGSVPTPTPQGSATIGGAVGGVVNGGVLSTGAAAGGLLKVKGGKR